MGLFGKMDQENIPDKMHNIDDGTYHFVVEKAYLVHKEDFNGLSILYAIDDQESEFHGKKVSRLLAIPDFDPEDPDAFEKLDRDGKRQIVLLRTTLRRGHDLTPEEIEDFDDPSTLIGDEGFITIENRDGYGKSKGRTFQNITDVMSKRLYDEENAGPDESAAPFDM